MALYARKREREPEREMFVFETEFIEELGDTAGDVVEQLDTSHPSYTPTLITHYG